MEQEVEHGFSNLSSMEMHCTSSSGSDDDTGCPAAAEQKDHQVTASPLPRRRLSEPQVASTRSDSMAAVKLKEFWGRATSDVWRFFRFEVDQNGCYIDKKLAVCLECRKRIKYCGNTTNLAHHLYKKHYILRQGQNPPEQSNTFPVNVHSGSPGGTKFQVRKNEKLPVDSSKLRKVTDALTKFFYKELCPLNILDSNNFRELCHALDPGFGLPHQHYFISNVLTPLYENEVVHLKESVSAAKWHCISLEIWQSYQSETSVTVTCHFINDDWHLISSCLQTFSLLSKKCGCLVQELKCLVEEWNLNIPVVVFDPRHGFVTEAVKLLKWVPMPCLGHSLNSAIRKALNLPRVANLLDSVRNVVAFVQGRGDAAEILEEKPQLSQSLSANLQMDNDSVWSSTLDILEKFIKEERTLCAVLVASPSDRHLIPSEKMMSEIRNLVEILQPYKMATVHLSSAQYPSSSTSSILFPVLEKLRSSFVKSPTSIDFGQCLKSAIQEELTAYYQEETMQQFMLISSAMDPRVKSLSFLSQAKREQVFNEVKLEARNFRSRELTAEGSEQTETAVNIKREIVEPDEVNWMNFSSSPATVSQAHADRYRMSPPAKKLKPDDFGSWLGDIVLTSDENPEQIDNELQRYRIERDFSLSSNPMEWWRVYSGTYPHLSCLARKYLCVPATSEPPDRVFSLTSNAIHAKWACLDSSTRNMMIFLNQNLK
ncbi:hypothetical protein CHS0354_013432 [Potamilus streckersoni]|uniref:BED-type domain-containing protein n=1 Tax=Potamilus streckersoni TaxID=2493646 RepID=A0AAE0RV28_9BIVA|nr:hypothetical protein CHS0354_013432 [Potamilus streckersoni]